jgi:hypothetical protein
MLVRERLNKLLLVAEIVGATSVATGRGSGPKHFGVAVARCTTGAAQGTATVSRLKSLPQNQPLPVCTVLRIAVDFVPWEWSEQVRIF